MKFLKGVREQIRVERKKRVALREERYVPKLKDKHLLLLPVKVEEDGQHGLVDVAVTDAFIEQEAGVSHH